MTQHTRYDLPANAQPLTYRVNQALQANPYLSGTHLSFSAKSGTVTLRGSVSSFYQKQMAQEVVQSLHDVREINNLIEVTNPR